MNPDEEEEIKDEVSQTVSEEMSDEASQEMPIEVIEVEPAESESTSAEAADELEIPEILPILPLRNTVVFPQTVLPLSADQQRSIRLVDAAVAGNRLIGLVAMQDAEIDVPGPSDVYEIATVAMVHRLLRAPDGSVRLIIQGLKRIRITEWIAEEPYLQARVVPHPERMDVNVELEALSRNIITQFGRMVELVPHLPDELLMAAEGPMMRGSWPIW